MATVHSLVHQQSTSTGTGNFTLASVNGKRTFDTAFGHGATTDVFYYFISNQSAAEYEWGTGHMSDATTLVRDTVIGSSNSNAAVSFSAGTKDVACDIPAASQIINPLTTAGDLLYYSTLPARLGIGSAYQKLRTNSGATAPEWADSGYVVASGSFPAATTLSVALPQTGFSDVLMIWNGLSHNNNSNSLTVVQRISTNSGVSYDSTSGNYPGVVMDGGNATVGTKGSASIVDLAGMSGGSSQSGWAFIKNYTNSTVKPTFGFGQNNSKLTAGYYSVGSSVTNIQFSLTGIGGGSFDAGTYVVVVY